MPFNITIDHAKTSLGSERSSLDDEEDSSGTGVQVSPPSASGSQHYSDSFEEERDWDHVDLRYPDEIKPSDSASRPRTSNQHRPRENSSSRGTQRHPSRRHIDRETLAHRRQHPPPDSPGSVDSAEDYVGYARGPPERSRYWGPVANAPPVNYPNSTASGPTYSPYVHGGIPPASNQLVQLGGAPGYPYVQPFSPLSNPSGPGYFGHGHHPPPPVGHPMTSHGGTPYGGPTYHGHEMMPYGPGPGYFPYPQQPYAMPPGAMPHYYPPYPRMQSPSQVGTPPPDTASTEAIARLEKLFIDQKKEQEDKEAAIQKAAADKLAKEEREKADKKIADEAAAKATAAAKAEAEKKAAEEAAKAKKAAEAAAAAAKPPEEKKKPIKFKDAVGRKFSFPFHLCSTWAGMEELIRQAFLHVEVIGPHVADGHYDLVGPNGDIILPQVWETVIEPDWTVTMHMWPMPEKPKTPDLPPLDMDGDVPIVLVNPKKKGGHAPGAPLPPPFAPGVPIIKDGGPPPPPPLGGGPPIPPPLFPGVQIIDDGPPSGPPKKARPREREPVGGGLAMWMAGRSKSTKGPSSLKAEKKPEVAAPHGDYNVVCRVM